MSFTNRTGQNLNRKKIIIINQTPNEIIADIERADTVTEEGTPINATIFNKFQEEINSANLKSEEARTKSNDTSSRLANMFSFDGTTLTINSN